MAVAAAAAFQWAVTCKLTPALGLCAASGPAASAAGALRAGAVRRAVTAMVSVARVFANTLALASAAWAIRQELYPTHQQLGGFCQ